MRTIAGNRKFKNGMEKRMEHDMIVGNKEFSYCMPEQETVSTSQQIAALELERMRRLIW